MSRCISAKNEVSTTTFWWKKFKIVKFYFTVPLGVCTGLYRCVDSRKRNIGIFSWVSCCSIYLRMCHCHPCRVLPDIQDWIASILVETLQGWHMEVPRKCILGNSKKRIMPFLDPHCAYRGMKRLLACCRSINTRVFNQSTLMQSTWQLMVKGRPCDVRETRLEASLSGYVVIV